MIVHDMSESPYTSGYTGVSFDKYKGTWRASLTVNGKVYSDTGYDTELDAYDARLELEHYYLPE